MTSGAGGDSARPRVSGPVSWPLIGTRTATSLGYCQIRCLSTALWTSASSRTQSLQLARTTPGTLKLLPASPPQGFPAGSLVYFIGIHLLGRRSQPIRAGEQERWLKLVREGGGCC